MVEFQNTPPRATIGTRDSEELLEDLCVALRDVAVRERNSLEQAENVRQVVLIATELKTRSVDTADRPDQLSQETGWLMKELFVDCQNFPPVLPRVRELDGIRRYLRCQFCKAAEHPEDDVTWGACDACLGRIIESLDTVDPLDGTVLFRTCNADWRCDHADADTVLAAPDGDEWTLARGACKKCLEDVLAQRAQR